MIERKYNFGNAKKLINKFRQDRSRLSTILFAPRNLQELIRQAYLTCQNERINELLVNDRIEIIPDIVKTTNLRRAGFNNAASLVNVSKYRLLRIYGIGEISAARIIIAVKQYHLSLKAETKVTLSFDNLNPNENKLLYLIYKFFNLEKLRNIAKIFDDDYFKRISKNINGLERCKGRFGWLFSRSGTKIIANESYDFLQNLERDEDYISRKTKLFDDYRKILNTDLDDALADFKIFPIKYHIFLEDAFSNDSGLSPANVSHSAIIDKQLLDNIINQDLMLDGLKCKLRKYQDLGTKFIIHQKRVLLGDEMGLGKTIQAIACMVHLHNNGLKHFLVICPAGIVLNWYREVLNHSNLKPFQIRGYSDETNQWIENGGVAIISYGMLKNLKISIAEIDFVVVDEAHYIKSPLALRTQLTNRFIKCSQYALLMTGTALENKTDEMINLINYLNSKIAEQARIISIHNNPMEFRKAIMGIYFRRKRSEVLDELPELIEKYDWCETTDEERIIYESDVLEKNISLARRVSWKIDDLHRSSKAMRLKEIIDEAKNEDRKIIIFSFFLSTLNSIKDFLNDESCYGIIQGSVQPKNRQMIIDDFGKGPVGSVLLSQIEAGGMGVNIQTASVVVICEPQYKPTIENQAISRAYRMGQVRNVIVHRLLCKETIDERLTNLLKNKQMIFDNYADKSEAVNQIDNTESAISLAFEDEFERISQKYDNYPSLTKDNYQYYSDLMNCTYDELVEKLLKKYGPVPGDYFLSETCQGKNHSITRSKEGLECHHIDENKYVNLSEVGRAKEYPFECQKADRLVYCNYLEHLLLHIKIAEESSNDSVLNLKGIGGAVKYIIKNLNDFYNNRVYENERFNIASKVVSPDFESYIKYLKLLIKVIKEHESYSFLFSNYDFAVGFNGEVNHKVLQRIQQK